MKKKVFWIVLAAVLLLAVLFVPIPGSAARDGGTRAYTALTYKVPYCTTIAAARATARAIASRRDETHVESL